jgi:hypothetical protein
MRNPKTGYAGAILVFLALLAGGAALWAVQEPASEQDEPPPPAAAAATEQAPAEVEQPVAAPAPSPNQQRVEDILAMLASGTAIPAELQDPAFDYYVDLSLLGTAWIDLDPALLTDLALQFSEGERVLLRPHRAIESGELMEIAIRTAAVKMDTKTLERLQKAVARSDNKELATELEKAKKAVAEETGTSAWMLPVATTSALEFARYKGMLQDIEAAIVVRDQATLEKLQTELKQMTDLPAEHREKLEGKVTQALEQFQDSEQEVSKAAQVLDKLAYATRREPFSGNLVLPGGSGRLDETPGGGSGTPGGGSGTPGGGSGTPGGGSGTPGGGSGTPGGGGSGGGGSGWLITHQPRMATICQAVSTSCPQGSVATRCPAVLTRCPLNVTRCPPKTTRCPPATTVCPPGCPPTDTQRPNEPTQCAPRLCQYPTQTPDEPTQCAPRLCQYPTQTPDEPTQCAPRLCQYPTQRPNEPTQCAPHLCQYPTQRPDEPTQCSPEQGKCQRPTLFPNIPTRCPAIQTRCPYAQTYCPPVCGQQQQQKQRWIPPRKGKYDSGGYYPGGAYPGGSYPGPGYPGGEENGMMTPYPRRYDFNLN